MRSLHTPIIEDSGSMSAGQAPPPVATATAVPVLAAGQASSPPPAYTAGEAPPPTAQATAVPVYSPAFAQAAAAMLVAAAIVLRPGDPDQKQLQDKASKASKELAIWVISVDKDFTDELEPLKKDAATPMYLTARTMQPAGKLCMIVGCGAGALGAVAMAIGTTTDHRAKRYYELNLGFNLATLFGIGTSLGSSAALCCGAGYAYAAGNYLQDPEWVTQQAQETATTLQARGLLAEYTKNAAKLRMQVKNDVLSKKAVAHYFRRDWIASVTGNDPKAKRSQSLGKGLEKYCDFVQENSPEGTGAVSDKRLKQLVDASQEIVTSTFEQLVADENGEWLHKRGLLDSGTIRLKLHTRGSFQDIRENRAWLIKENVARLNDPFVRQMHALELRGNPDYRCVLRNYVLQLSGAIKACCLCCTTLFQLLLCVAESRLSIHSTMQWRATTQML